MDDLEVNYILYRARGLQKPVGMNGIRYYGPSLREALKAFHAAKVGLDDWDRPDPAWGLLLYEVPRGYRRPERLLKARLPEQAVA